MTRDSNSDSSNNQGNVGDMIKNDDSDRIIDWKHEESNPKGYM